MWHRYVPHRCSGPLGCDQQNDNTYTGDGDEPAGRQEPSRVVPKPETFFFFWGGGTGAQPSCVLTIMCVRGVPRKILASGELEQILGGFKIILLPQGYVSVLT